MTPTNPPSDRAGREGLADIAESLGQILQRCRARWDQKDIGDIVRNLLHSIDPQNPYLTPPPRMKVCTQCGDTHRMADHYSGRDVMCTACPLPCRKCASNDGRGAFCQSTPCACPCHQKADTRSDGGGAGDVSDLRAAVTELIEAAVHDATCDQSDSSLSAEDHGRAKARFEAILRRISKSLFAAPPRLTEGGAGEAVTRLQSLIKAEYADWAKECRHPDDMPDWLVEASELIDQIADALPARQGEDEARLREILVDTVRALARDPEHPIDWDMIGAEISAFLEGWADRERALRASLEKAERERDEWKRCENLVFADKNAEMTRVHQEVGDFKQAHEILDRIGCPQADASGERLNITNRIAALAARTTGGEAG